MMYRFEKKDFYVDLCLMILNPLLRVVESSDWTKNVLFCYLQINENKELTAICDELISKVGPMTQINI